MLACGRPTEKTTTGSSARRRSTTRRTSSGSTRTSSRRHRLSQGSAAWASRAVRRNGRPELLEVCEKATDECGDLLARGSDLVDRATFGVGEVPADVALA